MRSANDECTSDSATRRAVLGRRLLRWYRRSRRDLPWRKDATPYRVWLSEVMLQQTQVETVIPYYRRFLRRFPSMAALARASVDDVLEVWAGLGYYSRPKNFHRAARIVVEEYRGRVPRDLDAMMALPGVGRYIAGAVLSIAYDLPFPIVDGNVTRILCRIFNIAGDPRSGRVRKRLWALAEELIPAGRAGDFNQAMMELGATVCSPKGPACPHCPVRAECEALRLGRQLDLPTPVKRKKTPHYHVPVGIIWRRRKLLITKRPMDAMLGGLWEFPGGKQERGESLEDACRREIREETGLAVTVGEHLISVKHAYSHFRVTLHAFHCDARRGRVRLTKCDDFRWVAPAELSDYPFPSGSRGIIESLQKGPS
jgi:A/G-specific adenine glycosylase